MTIKAVKSRIAAVRKIEKITSALEIVALTRLRRIEKKTENARAYFDTIRQLMFDLGENLVYEAHPMLKARKNIRASALVLFTSDKGLCGNFNNNIFQAADKLLSSAEDKSTKVVLIGDKGASFARKKNVDVIYRASSSLKNRSSQTTSIDVAGMLRDLYMAREIDEAYCVFNKFKLQFHGTAATMKMLPIKPEPFSVKRVRDYIYEPDEYFVLDEVIKEYITSQLEQCIFESNAAEEMARMLAMKEASDNTGELITGLNLTYHKLRQTKITRELIEIANTAECA